MGSGCTGQSSTGESERVRIHRQGNLTFFIHGTLYLENLVAGKGCRKTVAWHTNLTKEEIDLKIKEFWDTRVEGNPSVWTLLKHACDDLDSAATENLLKTHGLTMPNGLLQQTFDSRNHRYDLPPFVINPAVKYGVKQDNKEPSNFNIEKIRVTFRSTKYNDCSLEISNAELVKNLKEQLKKQWVESRKIRMFYAGKELIDGVAIGACGIKDSYIVQIFFMD